MLISRLMTASFSVVADWWVLIRTKPVSVYWRLMIDDQIGMNKPYVN